MPDHNQIISIDDWAPEEMYDGIFPKGAREKTVYFSPASLSLPFIKPSHRYLFKKSNQRYPWQFWMEIMAYRIGQIVGVTVPPAFAAASNKEDADGGPIYGALIEWFYGENDNYIDGGRLMAAVIVDFDPKKGTQHNLRSILALPAGTATKWAAILTFDTIIGNVDRHQDNWGIVVRKVKPEDLSEPRIMQWRLSPAFDNGTALNYEILESNFHKFDSADYTKRYLTKPQRARHHMRWSLAESGDMNFYEYMRRFLMAYPGERGAVEQVLNFTRESLEARLGPLTEIEVPAAVQLTRVRLDFTIGLIMKRKELLEKAIEVH